MKPEFDWGWLLVPFGLVVWAAIIVYVLVSVVGGMALTLLWIWVMVRSWWWAATAWWL